MSHSHKVHGELEGIRFLLEAASHGLEVSRPWGDSLPYDFLRRSARAGITYQVLVGTTYAAMKSSSRAVYPRESRRCMVITWYAWCRLWRDDFTCTR